MFKPNPLYAADAYKPGHIFMLAPGTTRLYGTWIPRSVKYAPKGVTKILSAGQQYTWRFIHDLFEECFFGGGMRKIIDNPEDKEKRPKLILTHKEVLKRKALQFAKDMTGVIGMPYNGDHFEALWDLGYLPLRVKSLPEGIETGTNIPHMTIINTVDGYAWLPLFLETFISNTAWKIPTAASTALAYRRNATKAVMETDPENEWFIDYACHDFSARGLDGIDSQIHVGLGHAMAFRGSDTLMAIPASRYYYGVNEDEVPINSVIASEHSVTCTQLFYYESKLKAGELNNRIEEYYAFDTPCEGSVEKPDYLAIAEWLNMEDWLQRFPQGILSYVADTFDLWKLITYILPRLKDKIIARDGKLVIRPDSGNPTDIICGTVIHNKDYKQYPKSPTGSGVIELLWDIFGGQGTSTGYKRLDSHIGAIYGDSITIDRQIEIYHRLKQKGFAATNIVLGIGSFTYQYNTRDTLGWAAKASWFEVEILEGPPEFSCEGVRKEAFNIFKDPITDDGIKKSLKGLVSVIERYTENPDGVTKSEYFAQTECSPEEEAQGLLQVIYEDGKFYNLTTLSQIRERIKKIS